MATTAISRIRNLDQRLLNISFPGEPVAYAVNCNDVYRISGVILNLMADILYMRIYAPLITFKLVAKGLLNKILPRENLAGRRWKTVEDLEFRWRDLQLLSVFFHFITLAVDHKAAVVKTHRLKDLTIAFPGPSEDSLDPVYQLFRTKGLHHIVISSKGETRDPLFLGIFRRKHDNREISHFLQLLAYLFTAYVRKHQVKDHCQRRLFHGSCYCVLPLLRIDHFISCILEIHLDDPGDFLVVFNEKN